MYRFTGIYEHDQIDRLSFLLAHLSQIAFRAQEKRNPNRLKKRLHNIIISGERLLI